MATFAPCGCEGASVYVNTLQFNHVGGLAGFDALNSISIVLAADRAVGLGGANILETDPGGGMYVPSELAAGISTSDTATVDLSGDGVTVNLSAAVKISAVAGNIIFAQADGIYSTGIASGVAPGTCDEALVDLGSGLSAGPKHYSRVAVAVATTPNDDSVMPTISGLNVPINQISLIVPNPSACRAMPFTATFIYDTPWIVQNQDAIVYMDFRERTYLISGPTPGFGTRTRIVRHNPHPAQEITSGETITYVVTGVIPPSDSVRLEAVMNMFLGSIIPVSYVTGLTIPLTGRVDFFGSTT